MATQNFIDVNFNENDLSEDLLLDEWEKNLNDLFKENEETYKRQSLNNL